MSEKAMSAERLKELRWFAANLVQTSLGNECGQSLNETLDEIARLRAQADEDEKVMQKAWAELDYLWRGTPMSTETEVAKNMLTLRLAARKP